MTSGNLGTGMGLDTGDRMEFTGKRESDFTCHKYYYFSLNQVHDNEFVSALK